MTDILLLIIIGKMFNMKFVYWIILAIFATICFMNARDDNENSNR